jgi:hypothetical protein
MNSLACRADATPSLLAVDEDPLVLTRLYEPEIGAVLWLREKEGWVDTLMDELCAQPLRASASGTINDMVAGLAAQVPLSIAGRDGLLADIALLSEMFAVLMDTAVLGTRLATLKGPMCPKWHTDRVVARMIVTFGAPGTEFAGQWSEQGLEAHPQQIICQAPAESVLILRGDLWPGCTGRGVWHRSPAACDNRLLITLDLL